MTAFSENRDEIIELSQLEVLGALEPADAVRLERLFRDATPLFQREVIEYQAELVTQTSFLPIVEPEGSLRLRVLASVAEAVEESDDQLAPIASIGRPVVGASGRDISAGESTLDSLSHRSLGYRRSAAEVSAPWRRSAFVWRAATLVLAGGLLASLAFNVATTRQATRISELALQRAVSDQLLGYIGPGLPTFLDQRCIVRGLTGATNRDNGVASVMLSPDFKQLMVVWLDLPTAQKYTLRSVDAATGATSEVGSVSIVNQVGGSRFDLPDGAAHAASEWDLVDERGAVVFKTRRE
ncbi:MAG: hypothetical protein EXS03_06950 [Phycisphaerales bacterium]|nr:hypothetical protein [Phycisphaerales bacterium]